MDSGPASKHKRFIVTRTQEHPKPNGANACARPASVFADKDKGLFGLQEFADKDKGYSIKRHEVRRKEVAECG